MSYKDTQQQFTESAAGGVVQNLNTDRVKATRIPLPPLEVQKQIVEECESIDAEVTQAQTIIEQAKAAIERNVQNWFESDYPQEKIEKVFTLEYGKGLPESQRISGEYPVMGSNGISGYHNQYLVEAPVVIVGRKGSAGKLVYVEKNCYPIDTTYYVKCVQNCNMKYIFYVLSNLGLEKMIVGIGVPGLNRNDVYQRTIPVPDLETQEKLVAEITALEAEITEARKIIESAAERKQAVMKRYL